MAANAQDSMPANAPVNTKRVGAMERKWLNNKASQGSASNTSMKVLDIPKDNDKAGTGMPNFGNTESRRNGTHSSDTLKRTQTKASALYRPGLLSDDRILAQLM